MADVELVEMSAVEDRSTCQGYAVVGKLVRHEGDMFTCTAAMGTTGRGCKAKTGFHAETIPMHARHK